MRKDYKYIEKATDLVICTTQKGANRLIELTENNFDNVNVLEELLLALEEDYIIVNNESTIDDWVKKINEELFIEEGITIPITAEHVLEGIKSGWIGFKTVIWDEGIQLEKEEQVIFRITISKKKFETEKNKYEYYKKVSNSNIIMMKDCIDVFRKIKIEQLIDGDYISKKSKKKKGDK